MKQLDPRLTPARPDLAALHLEGQVEAAHFVAGQKMRVREEVIGLRGEPSQEARLQTQALYGEDVMVYEDHEGWAWCQLLRDGYVGYCPANALGFADAAISHRVAVPRTFAWPGASIKHPILCALPLGARLSVVERRGEFGVLDSGGFVLLRHLVEINAFAPDFVAIAEQFLHVPYLWGGKTSLGLDCSGLVQICLDAAGIPAPRDSDLLEAAMGETLEIGEDPARLRRGDLVFWRGHVGFMQDAATLLHANGHHMLVVSEPLRVARDRILANSDGTMTSVRRLARSLR